MIHALAILCLYAVLVRSVVRATGDRARWR